jgi:indole-3-glycerol phosphate synthase
MNVLRTILEDKSAEVADAKRRISLGGIRQQSARVPGIRDFKGALLKPPIAVIAEVKKACPSKGTLIEKFDHLEMALQYQARGAHALSVLTDKKYFLGDKTFIQDIKDLTRLPILRKDFIIDEYQVYESRVLGADAVILLAGALSKEHLRELCQCAIGERLAVLVEVCCEEEIETANEIGAEIVAVSSSESINSQAILGHLIRMRPLIRKAALAVGQSGFISPEDFRSLQNAGYKAVLVGQGLISHTNRPSALPTIVAG